MGICAGSTQISGGRFCSFSHSILPRTTCRHLGSTVIFSLALTSQVLLCSVIFSGRRSAGGCWHVCCVSCNLSWGCSLPYLSEHLNAVCFACGTLTLATLCRCQQRTSWRTQNLLRLLFFSKISVPSRPAASVGNEHTRNA